MGGAEALQVDLLQLGQIAVHDDGRIKSFDSFARSTMRMVSGPHLIEARQPGVEYWAEHRGDSFYLRTSREAKNFRLVRRPVGGSAADAMTAMLDLSAEELSKSELDELRRRIEQTKRGQS